MTAKDIFNKVRVLLDEWTDDGTVIPDADVIDMQQKAVLLIDMAQKELLKQNKNYKVFEKAHSPIENLVNNGFEMREFLGTDMFFPTIDGVTGAQSYSIQVDDDSIIEIQEKQSGTWTTLNTITPTDISDYTLYKGIIVPLDSNNPIRLKLSGTTYYRARNIALFKILFPVDRIPSYAPYFEVEMPSDFRSIEDIVKEEWDTNRKYSEFPNFKWEGLNKLFINWYFNGNIRITYNAVPTDITSIDDVLEVDDVTAQAITYFVTSKIAPYEKKELVNFYEEKFNELKYEYNGEMQPEQGQIIDVYGDYNGNF